MGRATNLSFCLCLVSSLFFLAYPLWVREQDMCCNHHVHPCTYLHIHEVITRLMKGMDYFGATNSVFANMKVRVRKKLPTAIYQHGKNMPASGKVKSLQCSLQGDNKTRWWIGWDVGDRIWVSTEFISLHLCSFSLCCGWPKAHTAMYVTL